jgi:hypothetical protein
MRFSVEWKYHLRWFLGTEPEQRRLGFDQWGQSTTSVSNSPNMGSSVYSIAVNPVGGDTWLGTEQMGV